MAGFLRAVYYTCWTALYLNCRFWPKRPPLAFSVAETSVAEMSGPKRPRPKCPWPKCPSTTSTGRVGLCFLWFYVQELPKAQPAVVLVLKRLRRRGNGLKSHLADWEKPGIEPATPGLQDIGLSPTPQRLLYKAKKKNRCVYGLPTDPVL